MNKTTIIAMSAVFVASIFAITAFEAEAKPSQASTTCPAENVQHWYTLEISQELSFIELRSPTNPTLFDGERHWINVHQDSDDVIIFHETLIDKLTELGYEAFNLNAQTSSPLLDSFDWIVIHGLDVTTHTTICAE